MKNITIFITLIITDLFSQTCVDTIVATMSFLGVAPTQSFYLDSALSSYSKEDQPDKIKIHHWTNDFLDSISENGKTSWKFYENENNLSKNGTEIVVTKTSSNDTLSVSIELYFNGTARNMRAEEQHWPLGMKYKTYEIFDSITMIDSSSIEIKNDTAFITDNKGYLEGTGILISDKNGICTQYDSTDQKIAQFTTSYLTDGFKIDYYFYEEDSHTDFHYKYFDKTPNTAIIQNKTMIGKNKLSNDYNLLGQKVSKSHFQLLIENLIK